MLRQYPNGLFSDVDVRKQFSRSMHKEERSVFPASAGRFFVGYLCGYSPGIRNLGGCACSGYFFPEHWGFRALVGRSRVFERQTIVLGGRTSSEKQKKWVTSSLRRMDFYPSDLYLRFPTMRCNTNVFLHERFYFLYLSCETRGENICAFRKTDRNIFARAWRQGVAGRIRRHGLTIETGFWMHDIR